MTSMRSEAELAITSRPAEGLDDLRSAGELLSRAWLAGSPHVVWTPGDLSWWFTQSWPADLAEHLRLWSIGGRAVAWSWHDPDDDEGPAEIEYHAWSGDRALDVEIGRLVTLPGYRFEDDLVVEAPEGNLAAFTMAWWDPAARVGEFEPVGTHPEHQRRGLGKALLAHALRRYRRAGARLVQVQSSADN